MEPSAVILMVVGMVVIWGGLLASIAYAVSRERSRLDERIRSGDDERK